MIETRNLQLIPCGPSHLETVLRDKKGLEPLLGIPVPDSWPALPGAIPHIYEKLGSDPSAVGWWSYLFVHARDRVLATEAARGLLRWAFSHPEVATVAAETLPDGHGSIRVLQKLGMRFAGATDRVLRWRLDRQDSKKEGRVEPGRR